LEKVKQRESVLAEPFSRRSLLLFVEAVQEFDEPAECLLDRGAIFSRL
jgi:hypothetical protein